jgi:flagellar basal-body rod protein FlgG
MNDAMYIAATGMQAQQSNLNVIANNVANVNTSGFKRSKVNFHDMVHRQAASAELAGLDESSVHALGSAGVGVGVGTIAKQFSPGEIKRTDNPLDVAILGEGFLEVELADGSTAYSRGGSLQVNAENLLATAEGHVLKQRFQMPPETRGVTIAPDGQVTAVDARSKEWDLGRVELATFANPSALVSMGDNVYQASAESGEALAALPGEAGAGRLMQGQLESSNVKLIDEMVQLMVAQRAYEMNVKVIQAADEIASMTNSMRK